MLVSTVAKVSYMGRHIFGQFTHTHTTIVIYDTYNEIKIIALNCNISHTTQNLHKTKSDDGNLHYN